MDFPFCITGPSGGERVVAMCRWYDGKAHIISLAIMRKDGTCLRQQFEMEEA
jgi:hypothetical protein